MGETRRSGSNIGKDSLILTISQLLVLGINMVNVMLLSRFRSLEEYGTYSQIMMVCTIVITFFSAGFSQCINYFIAKEKNQENIKKFIQTYYSIVSSIGLVAGIITFLCIPFIKGYFDNEQISKFAFVLLIYPVSHILYSGVDRFFIVFGKTKQMFCLKICYSFVTLLEIIIVLLTNMTFFQYMVIYVVVEFINALLTVVWVKGISGVVPFGFDKTTAKSIIIFAVPMALASLVSTLNTELDKLVVGGFVNTEQLAIYTNAAKELPVYIFSTSISSVTMPHVVKLISNKQNKDAVHLWRKSITLSYFIICFFVTVLFVFAPQIVTVLYSEKYVPGVSVFRVYSLVLLFRITYYGMILNATGKTKTILKASIATMVTNLVFDFILFKLLGMIGPAIATLVSVSVMNMYQLLLTKKLASVRFTDIYPIKDILFCTLLNCALGVLFYLIQQLLFAKMNFDQVTLTICLGIAWVLTYLILVRKKVVSLWKQLNKGEI